MADNLVKFFSGFASDIEEYQKFIIFPDKVISESDLDDADKAILMSGDSKSIKKRLAKRKEITQDVPTKSPAKKGGSASKKSKAKTKAKTKQKQKKGK
jgi:hypothetical protein